MLQQIQTNTNSRQVQSPEYKGVNRAYLAFAYGRNNQGSDTYVPDTKTQYYNDEKKSKKKKTKTLAIIATTVLATAAIATTFIAGKAGNKNIQKILQALSSDNKNAVKAKGLMEKTGNAAANINNVKDDLLERLSGFLKQKNIPVLKHLDDYCQGTKKFYKTILKNSPLKTSYKKAADTLQKQGVQIEAFDDWLEKLDNNVTNVLKGENKDEFFTKGIFNKELAEKMTKGNIADSILIKDADFTKIAKNITADEIKLNKEGLEALEELNKTRSKVIAKMRDINSGSAATDFITDAVSLLTLGVAVKSADDKEEKKSIVLNLGLPLISSLGCAFIGNLMAIAGAPCMIFGLAMGQVAKLTAKGAENLTRKKRDKKYNDTAVKQ